MDQPFLLSIAIPTYNRPEAMARVLRSILPQLTPEVQVVIRDDSPGEETARIVHELLHGREDQVTYSHGEKLGIDRGTLWVVERSQAKFVWTFGDDDEMVPDGIARVLALVKKYPELGFIWTNVYTAGTAGPQLVLGGDRLFEKGDEVLFALTNKMTLLSTFIVNRAKAMPGMPLAEKHDRTMWSIMLLVYEAVATGPTYYFESPLVTNHLEAHGAGDVLSGVQVFGINFARVLLEFRGRFSDAAIHAVLDTTFGYVWRGFLVNRVRYGTAMPPRMRKDLLKIYGSYPGLWMLLLGSFVPRPVLVAGYNTYHVFFDHRHFRFGAGARAAKPTEISEDKKV